MSIATALLTLFVVCTGFALICVLLCACMVFLDNRRLANRSPEDIAFAKHAMEQVTKAHKRAKEQSK